MSSLSLSIPELFADYTKDIEGIFAKILEENKDIKAKLDFTFDAKALFRSIPSQRLVLIDWRGIASLWAISQAAARLSPAMFNSRRNNEKCLPINDGSEEELGLNFITYSKELSIHQDWCWNTYYPKPNRKSQSKSSEVGDLFFLRAIEWILRHEVGHIAGGHSDIAATADQSIHEERVADDYATRTIRGRFVKDEDRLPREKPSKDELELERRGLACGIALIWVAINEEGRCQQTSFYPPIADRIYRCLNELGLASDSATSEILADFIKAWIDPESSWITDEVDSTAQSAIDDTCARLDNYLRSER